MAVNAGYIRVRTFIQDTITRGLRRINQMTANLNRQFAMGNQRARQFAGGQAALGQQVAAAGARLQRFAQQHNVLKRQQQQTGLSTFRLINMMVRFGLILQGLRLIAMPFTVITQGISSLLDLDQGLRNITGMMSVQGDTVEILQERYDRMLESSQKLQRQFGLEAKDVVKGLYQVASVATTLKLDDLGIADLTAQAGKLATAGFMPLEDAAKGLVSTLSAMKLPGSSATQVMDLMSQTIKVGRAEMVDLIRYTGDFLSILGGVSPEAMRLQNLEEAFGIWGMLTTRLGPAEAGTAMKRMMEFIIDRSATAQDLVAEIKELSGGQVLLGAPDFARLGVRGYFTQIMEHLGPGSALLRQMTQQVTGQAPTEEQQFGVFAELMAELFGDSKALVGVMASLSDQGEEVNAVWAEMARKMGATDRALGQAERSMRFKIRRFQQVFVTFGQNLVQRFTEDVTTAMAGITNIVDRVQETDQFKNGSIFLKVKLMFDELNNAFGQWYNGGGREMIRQTGEEIGTGLASFIMGMFGVRLGPEAEANKQYFSSAGATFANSFIEGFWETLSQNLFAEGRWTDLLDSPMARGFAGAAVAPGGFFGKLAGAALGAGSAGGGADASDLAFMALMGLGIGPVRNKIFQAGKWGFGKARGAGLGGLKGFFGGTGFIGASGGAATLGTAGLLGAGAAGFFGGEMLGGAIGDMMGLPGSGLGLIDLIRANVDPNFAREVYAREHAVTPTTGAMAGQNIIYIEKFADTIQAGTPEQADQFAERVLLVLRNGLAASIENAGLSGTAAAALEP